MEDNYTPINNDLPSFSGSSYSSPPASSGSPPPAYQPGADYQPSHSSHTYNPPHVGGVPQSLPYQQSYQYQQAYDTSMNDSAVSSQSVFDESTSLYNMPPSTMYSADMLPHVANQPQKAANQVRMPGKRGRRPNAKADAPLPDEYDELLYRAWKNDRRKELSRQKKRRRRATPMNRAMEKLTEAEPGGLAMALLALNVVLPLILAGIVYAASHSWEGALCTCIVAWLAFSALFFFLHRDTRETMLVGVAAFRTCLGVSLLCLACIGTLSAFVIGVLIL